jgi:AcrR family transcriptional regulator
LTPVRALLTFKQQGPLNNKEKEVMEARHTLPHDDMGARERLLEAAAGLFAEKGYAAAPVREIVERAGVTKPVLYYYFKNKEGLFRAVLDWAAELQEHVLGEAINTPGSTLDRMLALTRQIYSGVMAYRNLFGMIRNLVFGPRQAAPEYDIDRYHRRMIDAISGLYREGMAKGEVVDADPAEVSLLVLGIIDFCLNLDRVCEREPDPERPQRLIRLAFEGLGNGRGRSPEKRGKDGVA